MKRPKTTAFMADGELSRRTWGCPWRAEEAGPAPEERRSKGIVHQRQQGPFWARKSLCAANSRQHERRPTRSLVCPLGDVVDLSSGGMRLVCSGKPPVSLRSIHSLKLSTQDASLSVKGRIVRIRRMSLKQHELGVEFLNVSKSLAAALYSLAQFGFVATDRSKQSRSDSQQNFNEQPSPIHAAVSLPDYYASLGVASDASRDDIHRAFRMIALKCHPDVCKDERSAQRFIDASRAYEVLKDSEARSAYDLRKAG